MTNISNKGSVESIKEYSLLQRRTARLAVLIEQDAPDIIIRNERRLVTEAFSQILSAPKGQGRSNASAAPAQRHPGGGSGNHAIKTDEPLVALSTAAAQQSDPKQIAHFY